MTFAQGASRIRKNPGIVRAPALLRLQSAPRPRARQHQKRPMARRPRHQIHPRNSEIVLRRELPWGRFPPDPRADAFTATEPAASLPGAAGARGATVNQPPKSVVREICTPRSVGAGGGRPPPVTRWALSNGRPLYRDSARILKGESPPNATARRPSGKTRAVAARKFRAAQLGPALGQGEARQRAAEKTPAGAGVRFGQSRETVGGGDDET